MYRYELLAPAGELAAIEPLIEAGADAIYAGLKGVSSRPQSADFSMEEIRLALEICHRHGVRLHVAINGGIPEAKLETVYSSLQELNAMGVDAVIIADWGILKCAREYLKNCEIHASTLTGAYNIETIHYLKELGVCRLVLSTNLFLDEIVDFVRAVPDMEYELVADGGVCFNDNRICELPHVNEGQKYTVFCRQPYVLCCSGSEKKANQIAAKQMSLDTVIKQYLEIGIFSYKIEGRTVDYRYIVPRVKRIKQALLSVQNYDQSPESVLHYVCERMPDPEFVSRITCSGAREEPGKEYAKHVSEQKAPEVYVGLTSYDDVESEALDSDLVDGWIIGDFFCDRHMFEYGKAGLYAMAHRITDLGKKVILQTPVYVTTRNFGEVIQRIRYFHDCLHVSCFLVQDIGIVRWMKKHFPDATAIWSRMGRNRASILNHRMMELLQDVGIRAMETSQKHRMDVLNKMGIHVFAVCGDLFYSTLSRECYQTYFLNRFDGSCERECVNRSMFLKKNEFTMGVNGCFLGYRIEYPQMDEFYKQVKDSPADIMVYAECMETALRYVKEIRR